jgi:hypothetical protein
MPIPDFESNGDLPVGLHQATLDEVLTRFGVGTVQRQAVTKRLIRIYNLAKATAQLRRFVIYGSYITDKPNPGDVDIFLVMQEGFDPETLGDDSKLLFEHGEVHDKLGASIFWVTLGNSFASIDFLITGWQTKRDKTRRGIIEVLV